LELINELYYEARPNKSQDIVYCVFVRCAYAGIVREKFYSSPFED